MSNIYSDRIYGNLNWSSVEFLYQHRFLTRKALMDYLYRYYKSNQLTQDQERLVIDFVNALIVKDDEESCYFQKLKSDNECNGLNVKQIVIEVLTGILRDSSRFPDDQLYDFFEDLWCDLGHPDLLQPLLKFYPQDLNFPGSLTEVMGKILDIEKSSTEILK